jgi:large subunit ribosomal protein L5e
VCVCVCVCVCLFLAYATGLLLARRHLTNLKLADRYQGKVDVTGEDEEQVFERQEGVPMPFRALLDVGLVRTTTGARVFAALKGAVDGGMNIPHSVNRFAGYDEEGQKLDAEALRKRIFAGHVADYMRQLSEEKPEQFKRQFSRFIKNNITADNLEKTIADTHAKIRANPAFVAKPKKEYPEKSKAPRFKGTPKKLTRAERKGRVAQKKNAIKARLARK